jgi:hypothetical protein
MSNRTRCGGFVATRFVRVFGIDVFGRRDRLPITGDTPREAP